MANQGQLRPVSLFPCALLGNPALADPTQVDRRSTAASDARQGEGGTDDTHYQRRRLLALGHTNQEIAKTLFISVRTAETHRAHIMQKLHLGEPGGELVRYALAEGLLDPQQDQSGTPDG